MEDSFGKTLRLADEYEEAVIEELEDRVEWEYPELSMAERQIEIDNYLSRIHKQ